MRLNRLDLIRYGKFTGRSLDFGEARPGRADFHLVYGPNEAGKSTLFSAFLDLLFGIERLSGYGFLHPYATMRVGGVIETGGKVHSVSRIKRNQNSLLGPDDQPLPDNLFSAALGSIDRATYQMMFSLDDDSIEKGGESILKSEGELGALLFSASSRPAGQQRHPVRIESAGGCLLQAAGTQAQAGGTQGRIGCAKGRKGGYRHQRARVFKLAQAARRRCRAPSVGGNRTGRAARVPSIRRATRSRLCRFWRGCAACAPSLPVSPTCRSHRPTGMRCCRSCSARKPASMPGWRSWMPISTAEPPKSPPSSGMWLRWRYQPISAILIIRASKPATAPLPAICPIGSTSGAKIRCGYCGARRPPWPDCRDRGDHPHPARCFDRPAAGSRPEACRL